jgi:hypothetical protein
MQRDRLVGGIYEVGGGVRHTQAVEKQYWERSGIIPEVTDHVVINLSPGSE